MAKKSNKQSKSIQHLRKKQNKGVTFNRSQLLEECGDTKRAKAADECWKLNRHCQQNKNAGFHYKFDLLRHRTSNKLKYKSTKECGERSVLHMGQRKLLMTEIYFLTNFAKNNNSEILIYAGAAPGTHMRYIFDLFPNISEYILIDPAPFRVKVKEKFKKKIKLRRMFFTDKVAEEWRDYAKKNKKDILFISDIRLVDPEMEKEREVIERSVKQDMDNQIKWSNILQAKYSMVKFRLPWDRSTSIYPEGKIMIQPWAALTSSETRLIYKNGARNKTYNNADYEDQLFWHNRIGRPSCYNTPDRLKIDYKDGLDHCWDCTAEINLHNSYLKKFKPELSRGDRAKEVNKMISIVSKMLNSRLDRIPSENERISRRRKLHGSPKDLCQ